MANRIELRICSTQLAEIAPFDNVPRGKALRWYLDRFGTSFGRMLSESIHGKNDRPIEAMLLAPKGIEFANPDQIGWAIHVAGMTACIQGLPSNAADEIEAFADGKPPFSSVHPRLSALGVYAVAPHATCLRFAEWTTQLNEEVLTKEAGDLHGAEWAPTIVALVNSLGRIFGSVSIHGGDIAAWRSAA